MQSRIALWGSVASIIALLIAINQVYFPDKAIIASNEISQVSSMPLLKNPPIITLIDSAIAGCELKSGFIVGEVLKAGDIYEDLSIYTFLEESTSYVHHLYLDESPIDKYKKFWLKNYLVEGRKLRIRPLICGSGGISLIASVQSISASPTITESN